MSNIIGFLRSSQRFNDFVTIEELSFFPQLLEIGLAELDNSIFFSDFERPPCFDQTPFVEAKLPSWVDFFEILRVGDNLATLPLADCDPIETSLGALAHATGYGGGLEQPTFGRRMVVVSFDEDRTLREVEKCESASRRALGHTATGVWHGHNVVAYCFVDPRSVDRISEGLQDVGEEHVTDYIVVEPLDLLKTDKSALSPLAQWLHSGYRAPPRNVGRRG